MGQSSNKKQKVEKKQTKADQDAGRD